MADYTNRQLATIIAGVADEFEKSVKKEKENIEKLNNLNNELVSLNNVFSDNATAMIAILNDGIKEMKKTSETPISVDLSYVNREYEKKVAENIEKINKRLKVPDSSLYVLLAGVVCFLLSGLFLYFSLESKQEIQTKYHSKLLENSAIIGQEDKKLLDDMVKWFDGNPRTKKTFEEWRKNYR